MGGGDAARRAGGRAREASWTSHAAVESAGEKFQQLDGALRKKILQYNNREQEVLLTIDHPVISTGKNDAAFIQYIYCHQPSQIQLHFRIAICKM